MSKTTIIDGPTSIPAKLIINGEEIDVAIVSRSYEEENVTQGWPYTKFSRSFITETFTCVREFEKII